MMEQAGMSVLFVIREEDARFDTLIRFLADAVGLTVSRASALPQNLVGVDAVVTDGSLGDEDAAGRLLAHVESGGGWLPWAGEDHPALPDAAGVAAAPPLPNCELRVLFRNARHPMADRLPDAAYLKGPLVPLEPVRDDVEILLYADWRYTHRWVATRRRRGKGRIAAVSLQDTAHPFVHRVVLRLLRWLSGLPESPPPLGVGILGYAPSVGRLHGLGARHTAGLALKAACDLDAGRREAARKDFPDIALLESSRELGESAEVDLVLVATPPDTHARLSMEMLSAGKHVVCEKPLALGRREAEAMAAAARDRRRHLSCHQNRRWDPDYRAIRAALEDGLVGEPFYLETFVGGHHHPCGYWHSHAPVCGGQAFDWGAHYIDWIVGLFPEPVAAVVGTRHKRVWHDVTNSDQERIQIRFASGREAEFLHSDIAAIPKPKWYLLGTRGAIVGLWRKVSAIAFEPDHYYRRDPIPETEMPPDLTARCRSADGGFTERTIDVPPREPFAFHRNLADHLLTGEALTAPLADSMKVVAILEAAARSAERGGSPEAIDG